MKVKHKVTGKEYEYLDVIQQQFPNGFDEYQEDIWLVLRGEDGKIAYWPAEQVELQ